MKNFRNFENFKLYPKVNRTGVKKILINILLTLETMQLIIKPWRRSQGPCNIYELWSHILSNPRGSSVADEAWETNKMTKYFKKLASFMKKHWKLDIKVEKLFLGHLKFARNLLLNPLGSFLGPASGKNWINKNVKRAPRDDERGMGDSGVGWG